MDEEILNEVENTEDTSEETGFGYDYPIVDETNNEITNPDLTLGYLRKEQFTIYHESVPEEWHYKVVQFDFADGDHYKPTSESDPHIEVIDNVKGIFNYVPQPGEEEKTIVGQTIAPIISQAFIPAWEETKTLLRYIKYTEKELADRDFLTNGPAALANAQAALAGAQATIDDLLLVLADLLGGADEEI